MKLFKKDNLFIIILALVSGVISFYAGSNNFAIILLLTFTQLIEDKTDKKSVYLYPLMFFLSVGLFSFNPFMALVVYEIVRLLKKKMSGIEQSVFSLVPILTLFLTANEIVPTGSDHRIYYFLIATILIYIEGLKGSTSWTSLSVLIYFLTTTTIPETKLILPFYVSGFILILAGSKLLNIKNTLFSPVVMSVIGLVFLSLTQEKIFSFLIVAIVYERMSSIRRFRREVTDLVFASTLIYFSSKWLLNFKSVSDLYPALFFLVPLFFLGGKKHRSAPIEVGFERTGVFSLLIYILGVIIYAY